MGLTKTRNETSGHTHDPRHIITRAFSGEVLSEFVCKTCPAKGVSINAMAIDWKEPEEDEIISAEKPGLETEQLGDGPCFAANMASELRRQPTLELYI